FKDQAVTIEPAAGIRGQRLGAGVEDAAIGCGAADNSGVDVERAIVPGGYAGRDLHAVVVNVRAGPVFGGALELAEIFQVRRAAGRDHGGIETMRTDAGQRLVEEFLRLGPARLGWVQHEACEVQSL